MASLSPICPSSPNTSGGSPIIWNRPPWIPFLVRRHRRRGRERERGVCVCVCVCVNRSRQKRRVGTRKEQEGEVRGPRRRRGSNCIPGRGGREERVFLTRERERERERERRERDGEPREKPQRDAHPHARRGDRGRALLRQPPYCGVLSGYFSLSLSLVACLLSSLSAHLVPRLSFCLSFSFPI